MRSDTDSDLTASLTSVARLIRRANELGKRSVQAAQAGNPDGAMNLALEVELLLDEVADMLEVAFTIRARARDLGQPARRRKRPNQKPLIRANS